MGEVHASLTGWTDKLQVKQNAIHTSVYKSIPSQRTYVVLVPDLAVLQQINFENHFNLEGMRHVGGSINSTYVNKMAQMVTIDRLFHK